MLLSEWRVLVGFIVLTVVLGLLTFLTVPAMTYFVVGAISGALASIVGASMARARTWPVVKQVIRWEEWTA